MLRRGWAVVEGALSLSWLVKNSVISMDIVMPAVLQTEKISWFTASFMVEGLASARYDNLGSTVRSV